MTTIAAYTDERRACLITDGAGTGLTGKVAAYLPKQIALPHLNCAIAVRGGASHLPAFVNGLCLASRSLGAEGFAEAVRNAASVLRLMANPVLKALRLTKADMCDVVLAGFGPTGPAIWFVANHDGIPGVKAFEPVEVDGLLCLPSDDFVAEQGRQIVKAGGGYAPVARRLLTLTRRMEAPDVNGRTTCQTAGFGQVTVVAESGSFTEVVGRWHGDVPGARPDPAEALA